MIAYIPRIEAMPETAPAYDDLRKPKDFPRAQCMHSAKRGCQCYTQQGSLMRDYPRELCMARVSDGYFDPTRTPSSGEREARGAGASEVRASGRASARDAVSRTAETF
jgi:zonular occludens toxin